MPKPGRDDRAEADLRRDIRRLRDQAADYARKARWCFDHGHIAKGHGWLGLAVKYGQMADETEAA